MFLSHADDVADHAAFQRKFGCERILHGADVRATTRSVETKLAGTDPVRLDDDLLAIPVPGHTRGSTALLYKDEILFTGDHLWFGRSRSPVRVPGVSAGIRGASKFARWSACSTTVSSG